MTLPLLWLPFDVFLTLQLSKSHRFLSLMACIYCQEDSHPEHENRTTLPPRAHLLVLHHFLPDI